MTHAATFVYVSISGENTIQVYQQNPADGALTLAHKVEVGGAPGSLAIGPSKRHLYAAVRSKGNVATLAIDPATGNLKQIGTTAVVADPVYIYTDRAERFLLTSYYGAGSAAIYPLGKDGIVVGDATSIVTTDKNPHSIMIDPSNQFVYVPNTGADKVLQYRFDAMTGKLAANTPAEVLTGPGTGPRHFWFHPTLPIVYFVNEKGSSVTVCDWNRTTGTLAVKQTIPTLPAGSTTKNSCAHIETTPSGKYLYASNRGHDSLAMYTIDPSTGELKSLGQEPTEATPRAFTIDPAGSYVYSAGQGSGKLAAYKLDAATGKLARFATYEVGKSPAWVLAVKFD
ncbi:MAG: lactonase family protein [Planctomycetaceae bacterium]|nr:lactonase family protein [Planctomycetaceae bacterium]